MCGIVGYTGSNNAAEIILAGLTNLEYRGYDSAGMSLINGNEIMTIRSAGRLQNLIKKYEQLGKPTSTLGIGHTRWATHGAPSDKNSHPHYTAKLSLVHNGIIENYLSIKSFLLEKGYSFSSETDTEALAKLIDYHYNGDVTATLTAALNRVEGSYALGIIFADKPDAIYAVRKDSPLIVGLGDGENFIASDVPAILEYTRDYYLLDEREIAEVKANSVTVCDQNGKPVEKKRITATWNVEQARKLGYDHFMLKEINEQPHVLNDTIHPRISDDLPDFSVDGLPQFFFKNYDRISIVACGTAMHAGIVGKSIIEKLAQVPVEVDFASEFRYRNPILNTGTLVIAISQSGETADTLAAIRLAKSRGVDTLAIVNVAGSSIAREAKYVLHTYAGPEIAVASTKAFSVQLGILYLIAIKMAFDKVRISEQETKAMTKNLLATVELTKEVLKQSDYLKKLSVMFEDTSSLFYMGRGVDYALAMEGSLKLKEISYIHSEAYAAGELKHGTIALITEAVPVIGLITQSDLLPKIISNIKETRARGAYVLIITKEGFEIDDECCDEILRLPDVDDMFMPILSVIALQLFAYHVAVARGCDVDKPRNLAKSVTVE